jgi:adenylate cyclase class 2
MLEVEAKYKLTDPTWVEARLRDWGAVVVSEHTEVDHYLNAPDRDFARTDEAFRLRQIGEKNFLTYKGPRHDSVSKTRTEVEVACAPGTASTEAFLKLLGYLGYGLTAVVRKRRRIHEWKRGRFAIHACIDDVERVGKFIELEIVAAEEDLETARTTIFATAADLGLENSETRSYLEQLLGRAVPPGGVR